MTRIDLISYSFCVLQIDVFFSDISRLRGRDDIEVLTSLAACKIGGAAMMTRKDSKFNEWWNPASSKLIGTKVYIDICNDVTIKHGKLVPGIYFCWVVLGDAT